MIIVILFVLGLCLGSFVNAACWRMHQQALAEQAMRKGAKRVRNKELSIVSGRSMCTHCKHPLATYDLIPLLSWLALRGKCRYCGKTIEDNPIAELSTALIFVISYLFWPYAFDSQGVFLFVLWCLFNVGFVTMIIYDFKWMILPDRVVYPVFWLGAAQAITVALFFDGGAGSVWQAILGSLIGGGLFYVLFQLSAGKWIGGGDVKLGAALGLVLGSPSKAILMLFMASLLGTLVALPLLATKRLKRTSKMPFGPYLIVASIIVYLFGASLITWYKRKFLFY